MAKGNKRNDVDDENSIQSIGDESDFEKSISVNDDTAYDSNDEGCSDGPIDPAFLKNLRKLVTPSKAKLSRRTTRNVERKRANDVVRGIDIGGKKAISRCNLGYFSKVIKSLSVDSKNIIRRYGFGCLLEFDSEPVPRSFAQWIADHVNTRSGDIVLDTKVIPMSPKSVHMVLGIPFGGRPMKFNIDATKSAFLEVIGKDSLPTIKFFGSSIIKGKLDEDELVRNFLVVALSIFLCPNSNTFLSTKYLGALINPKEAKDFDMSKFVFEWLIAYIRKYKRDCQKPSDGPTTLGGCIYKLAVIYLDFLDFGLRTVPIGLPRITVWKHSMIKQFASLDCKLNQEFYMRPVKDISLTVYKSGCVGCCAAHSDVDSHSSEFRSLLDAKVDGIMPHKVKDDIVEIFARFEMQVDKKCVRPAENLVLDVIECLIVASGCRSQTNDDDSQANDHVPYSEDNNDDVKDTERLNSIDQDDTFGDHATLKVTTDEGTIEVPAENEVDRPSRKREWTRIDDQQNNIQDSVSSRTRRQLKSLESDRNSPSIQGDRDIAGITVQGNSGPNVDAVHVQQKDVILPRSRTIQQILRQLSENKNQELDDALTSIQDQTTLNNSAINTSSQCFSPHQTPIMMDTVPFRNDVVQVHNLHTPTQAKPISSQPPPPSMDLAIRKSFHNRPIMMQTLPFTNDDVQVHNSHMSSQAKQKPSQPPATSMPIPIAKCVDISSQDSPEVLFRGEKKFVQTCNEMCNTSDELYNRRSNENNSAKASRSSSGKRQEQHAPKRLLAPSKYKASPYGDNKMKFSVSSSETKYHDAIVRIADIAEYKYNDCIDYGRVKVTFSSLACSLKRRGTFHEVESLSK